MAAVAQRLELEPLAQIREGYYAGTFDWASTSYPTLHDWLETFRKSIPQYRKLALADPTVPQERRQAQAEAFVAAFTKVLEQIGADPAAQLPGMRDPKPSAVSLCALREKCLVDAGYRDIFRDVKTSESAKALQLLPALLKELDGIQDDCARFETVVRGVLAGNLFDLGAASSAELFDAGEVVFASTRDKLLPRPWAVDDVDALLAHWRGAKPYRKALIFVDNAGSDVVLGMLPLARELLKRGTEVVLAANELPAVNDVTAPELEQILQVAAADPLLGRAAAEGAVRVVSSGSDLPVIDLARISPALNAAAGDADLVVCEGMGRGIETNLRQSFKCDSLKIAMIKHPEVAACLQGRMYDGVCRFDRVA